MKMRQVKICNIVLGEQASRSACSAGEFYIHFDSVKLGEPLHQHVYGSQAAFPVDVEFDFDEGRVTFRTDSGAIEKDLIDFLCFAKQYA